MQVIDLTSESPPASPGGRKGNDNDDNDDIGGVGGHVGPSSIVRRRPVRSIENPGLPSERRVVTDRGGNEQVAQAIDVDAEDGQDIVFLRRQERRDLALPPQGYAGSLAQDADDAGRWLDRVLAGSSTGSHDIFSRTAASGISSEGSSRRSNAPGLTIQSSNPSTFNRNHRGLPAPGVRGHAYPFDAPLSASSHRLGPMGEAAARFSRDSSHGTHPSSRATTYTPPFRQSAPPLSVEDQEMSDAAYARALDAEERLQAAEDRRERLQAVIRAAEQNQRAGGGRHAQRRWPDPIDVGGGWGLGGIVHGVLGGVHGLYQNFRNWDNPFANVGNFLGADAEPPRHGAQNYFPGSAVGPDVERRRRAKKYSIRQSHPTFVKKLPGFSRDVIPPPERDEDSNEPVSSNQEQASPIQAGKSAYGSTASSTHAMPLGPRTNADGQTEDEASEDDIPLNAVTARVSAATAAAAAALRRTLPADAVSDLDPDGAGSSADSVGTADGSANSQSTGQTSVDGIAPAVSLQDQPDIALQDDKTHSPSVEIVQSALDSKNDDEPPLSGSKKTQRILAPVCASCLDPLYLHQTSTGRPYLLCCAHTVCHSCLSTARERAEHLANGFESTEGKGKGRADHDVSWRGTPFGEEFEEVRPTTKASKSKNRSKRKRAIPGPSKSTARTKPTPTKRRRVANTSDAGASRVSARLRAVGPTRESLAESSDEDAEETARAAADENWQPQPELTPPTPVKVEVENVEEDDIMNDGPRQPRVLRKRLQRKAQDISTSIATSKPAPQASNSIIAAALLEPDVNPHWVTCPIVGCKGQQTDLLAPMGSRNGPWEMFV